MGSSTPEHNDAAEPNHMLPSIVHSMIWWARVSSDGGIVRPSALATIARSRRGRQVGRRSARAGPTTRPPPGRTDGTGGAGVGSAIDRGSGGGDGAGGQRLGGEPERRQEPRTVWGSLTAPRIRRGPA
jgi:hypothetical protein